MFVYFFFFSSRRRHTRCSRDWSSDVCSAEVVHQADMVVSKGVPRPVRFERPGGLAALGVAQIGRDDAELPLELVERVERVGREARDRRIEPTARDHQQREAGASLFIMDANVAFLIERHEVSPGLVTRTRASSVSPVTPAEAGVQGRRLSGCPWIPACAGMTSQLI